MATIPCACIAELRKTVCLFAELLCLLRDAVDTRKPPLMEVSLDCIQKLISFKLLQGPVHHINHRCDAEAADLSEPSSNGRCGLVRGACQRCPLPPATSFDRRDSSAKKPEDESERGPAGMDFDSLPPQVRMRGGAGEGSATDGRTGG